MNVIGHQFDIVSVNVVVETAGDRVNAILTFLPWIQLLPSHDRLKLLRDQKVTSRYIEASGGKVGEPGRDSIYSAPVDIFLEILANQIKWAELKGRIETPGCPFIRAGQNKGREGAVGVNQ